MVLLDEVHQALPIDVLSVHLVDGVVQVAFVIVQVGRALLAFVAVQRCHIFHNILGELLPLFLPQHPRLSRTSGLWLLGCFLKLLFFEESGTLTLDHVEFLAYAGFEFFLYLDSELCSVYLLVLFVGRVDLFRSFN